MQVALDVSAAGTPVGVGSYTLALARALAATIPSGDALTLFWAFRPGRSAPPVADLSPSACLRGWPIPGRILGPLWRRGLPPSADFLAGRPDVFHSTSFLAPTVRRAALVQTVHDLAPLRHPDWAESGPVPPGAFLPLLQRARRVVAVSAFVAEEIRSAFPGVRERVQAVPHGVDASRFRPLPGSAPGHGLTPGGYVLSVGSLQPRKNPLRLLEAWRRLPAPGRPRLVWVGNPGWRDAPLRQGFGEDALWLRGVPDQDLPALYAGALAFCYPSLYEGFGLPILESMACGTPVLTSDRGAMKEVAGDAALLVDPESVDALHAGLRTLIDDSALRRDLRAKGLARAAGFTWERTARRMWEIYREAAQ